MVRYKPDSDDDKPAEPGRYLAQVAQATEKVSQGGSGQPYINLRFKDAMTGAHLCYDVAMLGGRGTHIGHTKLKALGCVTDLGDGEFDVNPFAIEGCRCVLTLKHEEYRGKVQAKPDMDAPGFGYEPESAWQQPTDQYGFPVDANGDVIPAADPEDTAGPDTAASTKDVPF